VKTSIQKLPKSQVEIFFEIPAEEFKDYFDKAVLILGKDLEIEGFRKGKAPKEIVGRELNPGKILEEAANLAARESYIKVILEDKIEAIGKPEIYITKIAKGSPLEFKARVATIPQIDLPDYKKIASKIKPKEVFVEEKEVEEAVNFLQKSRAKLSQKNTVSEIGDFLEISFQSPHIEEGKPQKDSFILGQGHFIPGFEENLAGLMAGAEKEFSLTFPENHLQKNLAGKLADFKVKVLSVQKIELPEINDDWAKSLGNFPNLEGLRKNLREGIKAEKNEEKRQKNRANILEKISKETSSEIPDILMDFEKDRMLGELKENLQNQIQMNFNDYLTKIKKTENELKDSFLPEAEKRVKNSLILREIAKREGFSVSEKEIEEKINEARPRYSAGVDLEKLKEYYEGVIKNEKVFQLLERL
jgi:trigger factor